MNKSKKGRLVRSGKFAMTCISYKLGGSSPLDIIAGVLVRDQGEQKQVEGYLKQLYEFDDKEHYERFIADFIIRDKEIVNG